MFLNLTQETCTGTGDILTLTGATTGMNAFGKTGNGVDGGSYSCVVDDADGTTYVAGIYTFDKTANTLTRNDTWNSTATAVDNNPATNIALSAGTHTVRCDVVSRTVFPVDTGIAGSINSKNHLNPPGAFKNTPSSSSTISANTAQFSKYYLPANITLDAMVVELAIGVDLSTARMGISEIKSDGTIGGILAQTAAFNTGTADVGKITALLTTNYHVSEARFVYVWIVADASVNVLVHSRNEVAATIGVIDNCDNRGFTYGTLTMAAPAAPTLPSPVVISSVGGNATLGMLLRYL